MRFLHKHPMIMIVIGVVGISLSSIFVRYSSAPSSVTAAFRLIWTVLLMSPVVLGKRSIRGELMSLNRKAKGMCILSGVFLAFHFWLWFESLKLTSVASSTAIVCTEVLWVSMGYCLFMKGRLGKKAIISIAVAFTGSIIIAFSDSMTGGVHAKGDLLALLSAVCVALYTLIGRSIRKTVSTTAYTYVVYVSCAGVLILISLMQKQNLLLFGKDAIIVGFLLALFSTILGHSIFSWCLKYFSPSFVSASKLTEPIVAAIFAAILFSEYPGILQIAGGLMIVLSVLYYSRIESENHKRQGRQ